MKPRLHMGWVLFALVMVWLECMGDVPKLLFPHRTSPAHFLIALTNFVAVTGLALYALGRTETRSFWRLYAPTYAFIIAFQFGIWMPTFVRATSEVVRADGMNFIIAAGMVTVTLPILATTVYSIVALFRLGDWIGPTRRPVGERQQQLRLPF